MRLVLMHSASVLTQHGPADVLVGRTPFVEYMERLLAPTSPVRVVLLHGNAGIGKSAIGDALAGRWEARGGSVHAVAVDALVAPTRVTDETAPRLLVVDTGASALPTAETEWLPFLQALRPQDRVLILTRVAIALPLDDGQIVSSRIGGLGGDDADALLAREGVALGRRTALAQWAAGSPVHLVLGAQALAQDPAWDPATAPAPRDLQEQLVGRLAGAAYHARRAGRTVLGLCAADQHAAAEDARRDDEAAACLERRLLELHRARRPRSVQTASASESPRLDLMSSLS